MKHTLKKITASIAAAVMCAIPTINALSANAYANENARYTYRKVFYVPTAKNIHHTVFGLACRTTNTDAPVADAIAPGTLIPGSGGGPGCHNAGGSFYFNNPNMTGIVFSEHVYCNSPSDYKEVSWFAYSYKANGDAIEHGVYSFITFLVGDINWDGIIDGNDYAMLNDAVNVQHISSYTWNTNINVWGTNYPAYKFDIDDDGDLDSNDVTLLLNYISNIPGYTKFLK